MAKEYKHAAMICICLSIFAIIGIVIGVIKSNPLIVIVLLLPTVVYEVYRTEGFYTKLASFGLLGILVAEFYFIIAKVSFDIFRFLGRTGRLVGSWNVTLGDIKIVSPFIMAILAIILFKRTAGRYTKWLAVIIFATSIVIVYTINPEILQYLFKNSVDKAVR